MSNKSKGKNWIGAVFGLLFVLGGVTVAYGSGGKMIVDYLLSASWVETPATINQIELDTVQGSESTTYSVKGSYAYSFNGVAYENDRISVSLGNDNFGRYWQDLYATLQASQGKNEATAFVNASNPSNAVLDRTFRWTWVIFASIFLCFLGGLGALIMWLSLRTPKNKDEARDQENSDEIKCNEKASYILQGILGTLFFVAGTLLSLVAIPDALSKGEYVPLVSILFAFVGAAIMYHAYKIYRTFYKFGVTTLSLDPPAPGVGGQLGGVFSIDNKKVGQSLRADSSLKALLTSRKRTGRSDSRIITTIWQEESPVYLTQTAHGVKGQFVFDVPADCQPSKDYDFNTSMQLKSDSSISWHVSIEGIFEHTDIGKIERSWNIHLADSPAAASNLLSIPEPFLKKAKDKLQSRALSSARNQIPITEDARYIEVLSAAGRHFKASLSLLLFGLVFGAGGMFSFLDGWWPGLLFLAVGALASAYSIFMFGKSVEVKIDKQTNILYSRQSWFGVVFSTRQGKLRDASQIDVEKTASQTIGKKYTEFYVLNFHSDGKDICVADQITGKHAAKALKLLILDRCFSESIKRKVA